jgi:hypothetical protein
MEKPPLLNIKKGKKVEKDDSLSLRLLIGNILGLDIWENL